MKQIIISAAAALVLTSGISFAESFLGDDVALYGPQTISGSDAIIINDVSSTNDAVPSFDNAEDSGLHSVADTLIQPTFGGKR